MCTVRAEWGGEKLIIKRLVGAKNDNYDKIITANKLLFASHVTIHTLIIVVVVSVRQKL